jgi:hypothetical protein
MMNRDRGDNPKLTLLPFLIAAMCRALRNWPMLNATFDDKGMTVTRHGSVDMGVATQTENGLMVPVIRGAERMSVSQIAAEILHQTVLSLYYIHLEVFLGPRIHAVLPRLAACPCIMRRAQERLLPPRSTRTLRPFLCRPEFVAPVADAFLMQSLTSRELQPSSV